MHPCGQTASGTSATLIFRFQQFRKEMKGIAGQDITAKWVCSHNYE